MKDIPVCAYKNIGKPQM